MYCNELFMRHLHSARQANVNAPQNLFLISNGHNGKRERDEEEASFEKKTQDCGIKWIQQNLSLLIRLNCMERKTFQLRLQMRMLIEIELKYDASYEEDRKKCCLVRRY